MKKHCIACQKEFTGRSDKRFCSAACKNGFNNAKRMGTRDAVREVDGFLHRNREILAMPSALPRCWPRRCSCWRCWA